MKKRIDHTKLIPEQKNHVEADPFADRDATIQQLTALKNIVNVTQELIKRGILTGHKKKLAEEILDSRADEFMQDAVLTQARFLLRKPEAVNAPLWIRLKYRIMKLLGRMKS
jgi:hypothetical protein